MADLSYLEKEKFEQLLDMPSGYVSDLKNRQFADFFFSTIKAQIYSEKYSTYGNSKANRLRAFWDTEPNSIVGKILKELLQREKISANKPNQDLYDYCEKTVNRLLGIKKEEKIEESTEDSFLQKEFKSINLNSLNIDVEMIPVLEQRLKEIEICLKHKASLSVIFLTGSSLEGLLLNFAIKKSREFNQAKASPKKEGKVLAFYDWSLNNLIDVSKELNLIGEDVKKFSHALRDFRNYIHPYAQMASKFNPDEHTAAICWQVLKAAIADLNKTG